MSEKNIKVRLQQKHDTSANWALATNFKPKAGELIIYDDLKKMKVGDGETLVNNLPFLSAEVSQPDYNQNDETASDYIKNRPFYKEDSEETTTYFDKTIDLAVSDNFFIYSESTPISLTAGDEVSVLFDGNIYSQTVFAHEGQILYIGNLSISGSDLINTGEPFLIIGNLNVATTEEGSTIAATEQKTNCHIKIYKTVDNSIYHYMDPTYIKDMYYEKDGKIHKVDNKYLDIVDSSDVNTLLPKTTITLQTENGISGGTFENIFHDKTYEFLNKYFTIIIDNKEYSSVMKITDGVAYIGNLAVYNDKSAQYDTGEPFFILLFPEQAQIFINSIASSLTLEIKEFEHISYKYLKDMYYTKHIHRTDLSLSFSTSVDDSNRNIYSRMDYDNDYGISSDKKYVVVYNGTEYAPEVKTGNVTYNDVQIQISYLGNLSLYDSTKTNTNEPFFVTTNNSIIPEWFGVLVVTSEAQTNATLDITADYDVIHYIDNKYIDATNRLKTWIKDAQATSSFSIPTPSKNTDLVDKQYVDDSKITSIDGLSGGVLTSPLVIDSTVGLNCKLYTDSSTSFPLIQYNGQEITIGTVVTKPLKIIGGKNSTIGGIKFNEIATKTEIPNIEEYSRIRWLSYNDTFSMTTSPDAKWYDTRGNEITAQIGTGNYVDSNCGNSLFNSTEDVIDLLSSLKALIFRVATENGTILPDKYIVSSNGYTIHAADIICLVEDDVPDRKAIGPNGLVYTVLKAKMINGAALDKANIFTKINTFNLGIKTVDNDASTTYKCGTIQYQYGSNNFTLTLPTAAGTFATQEYVTEQIGNIDTLLTALNSGTGV